MLVQSGDAGPSWQDPGSEHHTPSKHTLHRGNVHTFGKDAVGRPADEEGRAENDDDGTRNAKKPHPGRRKAVEKDFLFTWGAGNTGVLGHQTYEDEARPRPVDYDFGKITQISCGKFHLAVLDARGSGREKHTKCNVTREVSQGDFKRCQKYF